VRYASRLPSICELETTIPQYGLLVEHNIVVSGRNIENRILYISVVPDLSCLDQDVIYEVLKQERYLMLVSIEG
jgi:hypothetical protein